MIKYSSSGVSGIFRKEEQTNMKKLVVMYTEDPYNPKNTWSGTSYSLRKALEKYVDVIFVNYKKSRLTKIIEKFRVYANRLKIRTLAYALGGVHDYIRQCEANILLKKYSGIPVLEIADDVYLKDREYYIYQDLSIIIAQNISTDPVVSSIRGGGLRSEYPANELARQINIQKKEYECARKVFYMGKWVSDMMKETYPTMSGKFMHVGGGINQEFLQNKFSDVRQQNNIILFIGKDWKRKGLDLLIEAFCLMRQKYKIDAHLVVAGVDAKEKKDSLSEYISFVGNIDRRKIGKLLSEANVFCMPSFFEAYGLVFIEALCNGVPCVGVRRYEMQNFIEDGVNGALVDGYDVGDLADKLYEVLINPEIQKNTINNQNFYLKKYSWDTVAKSILDVIFAGEYQCRKQTDE